MKRQIPILNRDFTQYPDKPLIINAYELVYTSKEDLTAYTAKIRAIREDGTTVDDTMAISGFEAKYTLKNNMYAKEGRLLIRFSLFDTIGGHITTNELYFTVLSDGGETDLSGDDRLPALDQLIQECQKFKISVANKVDLDDFESAIALKADKKTTYTKDQTDILLAEKVVSEPGKGLSQENYTLEEKSKLLGIEENATKNATDAQLRDRSTHTGTQAISTISGLQGALDDRVNTIETINVDGLPLTINEKTVDIDLSEKANAAEVEEALEKKVSIAMPIHTEEVILSTSKEIYKFSKVGGNIEILFQVTPDFLAEIEDKNYRFEMILIIDNSANNAPAALSIQFHTPEGITSPHFLIPPDISFAHSNNKFAFETYDGGQIWYANQCYESEVL